MKMTVRASVCVRLRDPKLEEPKQSSLFTSSGAACAEFPPIKGSRHWVFFHTCSGDPRLEARLASTDGERSCSCVFSAHLQILSFLFCSWLSKTNARPTNLQESAHLCGNCLRLDASPFAKAQGHGHPCLCTWHNERSWIESLRGKVASVLH